MEYATSATVRSENDVLSLSFPEKAEIIRRFNERVDTALSNSPPTKAWVVKALRRGGAARCPVRFRRLSLDVILRYGDALADLFCAYPDDTVGAQPYDLFVGYQPPDRPCRLDPVKILTEDAQWTDEWGAEWRHAAGGVGASTVSNPLTDWSKLDDYLARQLPDPRAPDRLEHALPVRHDYGKTKYLYGMFHMLLFERQHCLRGMDNTFADFHLYPQHVQRLLDALTDYAIELVRVWGQWDELDGLLFTDDWGTQNSLMIAPTMWRKYFAVNYRRIFDEVHRFGKQVIFHSCGNVAAIIGDLIDVGVDVLDPVQPEALDLAEVAGNFGGKVEFSGGISDQKLVVMSPQQVRDDIRRTIDMLGARFDNAYLVAPSNSLTPEIPFENLQALFEASHT
jgi:uroporphyrinogen decarboxylase